jgi:NAD(P)-dependent dehydrogenase (short-subunit alcohol dehydrogenase family)
MVKTIRSKVGMGLAALPRMPEIADIAHAVDFLFSEKARNITGTVTTVDRLKRHFFSPLEMSLRAK